MTNRIEIGGGIISRRLDTGKPIYLLTSKGGGDEMVLAKYPSFGMALLDSQLAALGWQLSVHSRARGQNLGGQSNGQV